MMSRGIPQSNEESLVIAGLDCPDDVGQQLARFVDSTRELSAGDLTGIYLHGSLAMGCFNPTSSDLDLLVVHSRPMLVARKKSTVESLLELSGAPSPIEVSYLVAPDLLHWEYPTLYDLHYSEAWRARYRRDLSDGAWSTWNDAAAGHRDPDLAAHITVLRSGGVCLTGPPIADVFSTVPVDDFLSSILADLDWSLEPGRFSASPGYAVLNHCRVYRFLTDGSVCSKAEGAEWARCEIPSRFIETLDTALAAYRSGPSGASVTAVGARQVIDYLRAEIARLVGQRRSPGPDALPRVDGPV